MTAKTYRLVGIRADGQIDDLIELRRVRGSRRSVRAFKKAMLRNGSVKVIRQIVPT